MSMSSASGSTATVAAEVWMRPPDSVSGTRCTRWTPDSNFSLEKTPAPLDRGDHFSVAADLAFARRQELHLPAVEFGIALVHAEEIAREEPGLGPAGAGADFEDRALLVGGVLRQEQDADPAGQLSSRSFSSSISSSASSRISRSGRRVGQELAGPGQFLLGAAQLADRGDDFFQRGIFGGKPRIDLVLRPRRHFGSSLS